MTGEEAYTFFLTNGYWPNEATRTAGLQWAGQNLQPGAGGNVAGLNPYAQVWNGATQQYEQSSNAVDWGNAYGPTVVTPYNPAHHQWQDSAGNVLGAGPNAPYNGMPVGTVLGTYSYSPSEWTGTGWSQSQQTYTPPAVSMNPLFSGSGTTTGTGSTPGTGTTTTPGTSTGTTPGTSTGATPGTGTSGGVIPGAGYSPGSSSVPATNQTNQQYTDPWTSLATPIDFSMGNITPSSITASSAGNASTYNPYTASPQQQLTAQSASAVLPGQAAQASAPTPVTAAQAAASQIGPAQLAAGANVGPASTATASLAGPAQQIAAANAGPAERAQAAQIDRNSVGNVGAQSVLDFDINAYMNPWQQQVIQNTNAEIERQRRLMSLQTAEAAANARAFGGDRHGVADSLTNERALQQMINATAALNQAGYTEGMGLIKTDIANRMAADLANQRAALELGTTNANLQNATALANMAAANQMAQFNANLGQQAGMFNAGQANENSRLNAQLGSQVGMFNAGQANSLASLQAQLDAALNQFNASQQNQVSRENAQLAQQAGMFNAGQANSVNLANNQLGAQLGMFNAGQQNQLSSLGAQLGTQVNLANANASNDMARFNNTLDQQLNLANMLAQNQAGQFNAGQQNQQNQFNANLAQAANMLNANLGQTAAQQSAQNYINMLNQSIIQNMGLGNLSLAEQKELNDYAIRSGQLGLNAYTTAGNLANTGLNADLLAYLTGANMVGSDKTQTTQQPQSSLTNDLLGSLLLGYGLVRPT